MLSRFKRPLPNRDRWRVLSLLAGLCVFLLLVWFNAPLAAQNPTITQARVAEILDGSQVYIQNNQARVNDVADRGQQVRTGNARTQLNFNTGAVGRLSSNSVLTVGQCAQLQRGVLLVNGAVNGCTASITAGVWGTTYVLQVDETGQEEIQVLEGEVVVTQQQSDLQQDPAGEPENSALGRPRLLPQGTIQISSRQGQSPPASADPEDQSVVLTAGQEIATRRGQRLGSVQQITQADFVELLTGNLFDGFAAELPGISRIRDSFRRLFPNIPFPVGLPGAPNLLPIRPRLPF